MGFLSELLTGARRIRAPQLAARSDTLIQDGRTILQNLPQAGRNYIEGEPILTFLREGENTAQRGYYQAAAETIHSPEYIMGKTPPGQEIANDFGNAQVGYRNFLSENHRDFSEASKGITQGSESDANVFRALENPDLAATLNPQEKTLLDVIKPQNEFFAKRYTMHLVGDQPEAYNEVVRLAQLGDPAAVPEELQKGYSFYTRLKDNYAHHIFDPNELIEDATKSMNKLKNSLGSETNPDTVSAITDKIKEFESGIQDLKGGDPLAYESLPTEYKAKFEMTRKGKEGYTESAIKSYETYLYGMAKKIYLDPAIQKAVQVHFNNLPDELRPYAKWYIRDFAGYNHGSPLDELAAKITGAEYVRTLGFNLSSPLANLTQQMNTIADVGPKWAMKGYLKAFTPEGKAAWEASGLAAEVPMKLSENLSPAAGLIEKFSRYTGYFFNLAETANRKHAFLSYLEKYTAAGLDQATAVKQAIEGVHRTQFLYGKAGMPKILRNPVGKVALQYTSYPIKQAEFLWNLARKSPEKFLGWLGLQAGVNYTLGQAFGVDLSNALGFGVDFGEAFNAFKAMSKLDLDEAVAHTQLAFAGGNGMLPSGLGPAVSGAMKIFSALKSGDAVGATLKSELLPIQWNRVEKILSSIQNRSTAIEPGKWPVFSAKGERTFEADPTRILLGVGLRSKEMTDKQARIYMGQVNDRLDTKHQRTIAEAILDGNQVKAEKMMQMWGVRPSGEMVRTMKQMRDLPRDQRKKYIDLEKRQSAREQRGKENG